MKCLMALTFMAHLPFCRQAGFGESLGARPIPELFSSSYSGNSDKKHFYVNGTNHAVVWPQ